MLVSPPDPFNPILYPFNELLAFVSSSDQGTTPLQVGLTKILQGVVAGKPD